MPSLGGWEIVIIVAVLLLLFGAKKLPDMARSVGQSARVFKGEMKGLKDDEPKPTTPEPTTPEPDKAEQPPLPPAQSQATVAQPQERPVGDTTPETHGRTDAR